VLQTRPFILLDVIARIFGEEYRALKLFFM
jgi:hypothetical protein